ncbi:MAG: NAD(P)-dependent oxidoreductase [Anaerolineae bacterium]
MTDRFQILITADLTDQGLALLNSEDDVEVQQVNPTNAPKLREKLATAHALIARDDVVIDRALLDSAPVLRVIGRVGASVSGIDLETATSRGIIVMNAPGVNAVAAGELAVTLMLALSRSLIDVHNSLKSGFWLLDRKRQAGTQLSGKTLGLIGMGRVGTIVAQRCLSFGMTVLAYDPYIADDQLDDKRVTLVGLSELLRRSDYVSIHVPATGETRGMINASVISQMKPGARLINTAHGSVLDEAAVAAAVKDGKLAGVGVDVYGEEPPYNSPLIGLNNVIHTPHIGDNTVEATGDLSLLIVTQVLDALRGDDYRNVVNMPFVPGMDFEATRPYLQLAERIGSLIHVLGRNPICRVAVEYRGEDD